MASDLIRVHPPTGYLRAEQVATLAGADTRLVLVGAGDLEVARGPETAALLAAAGLHAHGAAHRVLCSPLTGRIGGHLDARAVALRLAESLRAHGSQGLDRDAGPAGLVGVDDGSGDLAGLGLVFAALSPTEFTVRADGVDTGTVLRHDGADADLADWLAAITERELDRATVATTAQELPIGWLEHADGGLVTLGAAVHGGVLEARQLQFLAALDRPVVLTPWRTLLLCDLDEWAAEQVVRVLAPLGFVFDAESPVVAELAHLP
ncbi:hypothetical protein [Tomitella biformata]|uniref:hypothetical protein n=1 Tax=Tomitella biformata TaxID=630403 RepID=UPI00046579B0|nr:hypothetical protein [Tomitella biformata]